MFLDYMCKIAVFLDNGTIVVISSDCDNFY